MLLPFFKLAVRNPRLIPLLLSAGWRFRRRDWYRKFPFLPLPTQEYVNWRMYTAYGSEAVQTSPTDLERYLRWAEWMNRNAAGTKEHEC